VAMLLEFFAVLLVFCFFFFSSRRRHTRCLSDWSSDVCSSDLVNLGFFGANSIYWQARLEPSTSGVPNRVLVCYRSASIDPTTDQIGRASCRERVEMSDVGGAWKEKE